MGQGLSTKAKTYGIDVYDFVRADILERLMRPGMRLKIQDLCALHDVSSGAVREALSLLTSEDRVELERERRHSVSRVMQEELLDVSDARIQLETLCINLAKENRFIDWEAEIIASRYRLCSIAECDPNEPYRLNDG